MNIVVPSYWARVSEYGWRHGDAVYDHPTPMDNDGTLPRMLQSLDVLEDKDFKLVIIAVATTGDIEEEVEKKVAGIIGKASDSTDIDVLMFGASQLKQVHELMLKMGGGEYISLLELKGYSNVRNLCLFVSHVLGSQAAVLIDDDEVFEDQGFMGKAKEFIGKEISGRTVNGVAGYYLRADGDYHAKIESDPWMKYWDKNERMNEAFDDIIGIGPRLKETPFVFGGNMVIHSDLFTVVPFDPGITRGEDIDYLINARMFGFSLFLDNQLSIKHLPPPKSHPLWMRLKEDIYRFVFEREKINSQEGRSEMTLVSPVDLGSYPGRFLEPDLDEKIEGSCNLLSGMYLKNGDTVGSEESLRNIELARTDAVPVSNPFQDLCELQERWKGLMEFTAREGVRSGLRKIIEG